MQRCGSQVITIRRLMRLLVIMAADGAQLFSFVAAADAASRSGAYSTLALYPHPCLCRHAQFAVLLFVAVTVVESGAQAIDALQRNKPGTFQLVLTVSDKQVSLVPSAQ